jgi:hypothetical protein
VKALFRALAHHQALTSSTIRVYVDHASLDINPTEASDLRRARQMKIPHFIAVAYAKLCPLLSILAALGIVCAVVRWRRATVSVPLLAGALGSIVAIFNNIALLAYINAISFPTYFLHYCSLALPFVILFILTGMFLGYCSLRPIRFESTQTRSGRK